MRPGLQRFSPRGLLLTVVLPFAGTGADAGRGRDGHQGVADGLLPALAHVPSHARRRQDGVVVQAAVVLPDVVHHVGRGHLEAVRVAAGGPAAEVLRRLHLQDLGQRDLLKGARAKQEVTLDSCHTS